MWARPSRWPRMPNEPTYGPRYCAFVDILGFAELVTGLGQAPTNVSLLKNLLATIHTPKGEHIRYFTGSDLRAQSISDAVCLSSESTAPGLSHLFYALEEIAMSLLELGYFVRGAIVKGPLYHDDRMVFGEALLRAFHLEQEIVRYPRIMVTTEVFHDTEVYLEHEQFGIEFSDSIIQADDGPRFFNIMRTMRTVLDMTDVPTERMLQMEKANILAARIQECFEASPDNPRHFEKVQWFAKYFNRSLERHAYGIHLVYGPGLDAEKWG